MTVIPENLKNEFTRKIPLNPIDLRYIVKTLDYDNKTYTVHCSTNDIAEEEFYKHYYVEDCSTAKKTKWVFKHHDDNTEVIWSFDCEFNGLIPWRDRVCLVQVYDNRNNVWCVHFEGLYQSKAESLLIKNIFMGSNKKIGHYIMQDVLFLKQHFYYDFVARTKETAVLSDEHFFDFPNLDDNKIKSHIINRGTSRHGLKSLVQQFCNISIDKGLHHDWENPTWYEIPENLSYAVVDTLYLLPVYTKMHNKVPHLESIYNRTCKTINFICNLNLMRISTGIFAHNFDSNEFYKYQ